MSSTAVATVSLDLECQLVDEARERAGDDLARYVARALRHELQRDRLAELLSAMTEEAGSIDAEVMNQVRDEWPAADDPAHHRDA